MLLVSASYIKMSQGRDTFEGVTISHGVMFLRTEF